MAIFSVLHIWAYPWKPYDLQHSKLVLAEGGPEFEHGYLGGPGGIKAFADAFNPWDVIKAIGRGFRWVAVGRSKRLQDESYKSHLEGTSLDSMNATDKAGRYQPLGGNDSQTNLSYHGGNRSQFLEHGSPNPKRNMGDTAYHGGAQRNHDPRHQHERGVSDQEIAGPKSSRGPWSDNPRTPWPPGVQEGAHYGDMR